MTDVSFDCPAGPLPGYLATPSGDGPWPGVVIVHDAFGVTRDVKRIADRFAANGYLALVPSLYARGNKVRCVVSTFQALSRGTGPAIDDLVAARDFLAADARSTGKVGSVGFCMGGGFCLVLAPRAVFDATAPNYGQLPKDFSQLRNSCPMVASYGARDLTLKGAAAKIEAALTDGGVPHDVKEYPQVGHSFMNEFGEPDVLTPVLRAARFAYSEPEAEDAWRRILAFFGNHLSTSP